VLQAFHVAQTTWNGLLKILWQREANTMTTTTQESTDASADFLPHKDEHGRRLQKRSERSQ